jgi:hypothetical protein
MVQIARKNALLNPESMIIEDRGMHELDPISMANKLAIAAEPVPRFLSPPTHLEFNPNICSGYNMEQELFSYHVNCLPAGITRKKVPDRLTGPMVLYDFKERNF